MQKMKAAGDNGATFGLVVNGQYYLQTLYPSGDWGEVQEVQEGGQFGWQHWVSAHDAYEIETFPAGCGLLQSETLMG